MHFVYIVRCADGTLYTGYAGDPVRREQAHNAGRGARYTSGRRPVRLIYSEECASRGEALKREHQNQAPDAEGEGGACPGISVTRTSRRAIRPLRISKSSTPRIQPPRPSHVHCHSARTFDPLTSMDPISMRKFGGFCVQLTRKLSPIAARPRWVFARPGERLDVDAVLFEEFEERHVLPRVHGAEERLGDGALIGAHVNRPEAARRAP